MTPEMASEIQSMAITVVDHLPMDSPQGALFILAGPGIIYRREGDVYAQLPPGMISGCGLPDPIVSAAAAVYAARDSA